MLSIFEKRHGPALTLVNDTEAYDFQLGYYEHPQPVILKGLSVAKATRLLKDLSTSNIPGCVQIAIGNGVIVGSIK